MPRQSKTLRAVGDGEKPPQRRMTVTEAAETGSERDLMVATLRVVSAALDDPGTAKRDIASLSKRVIDLKKDIAAIDAREEQEGGRREPTGDEAWTAV